MTPLTAGEQVNATLATFRPYTYTYIYIYICRERERASPKKLKRQKPIKVAI